MGEVKDGERFFTDMSLMGSSYLFVGNLLCGGDIICFESLDGI